MTISYDTIQIILILAVSAFAVIALVNTKKPVEDKYYNDRHDQIQFDSGNPGCVWFLIALAVCFVGFCYGFYWFFQSLGK